MTRSQRFILAMAGLLSLSFLGMSIAAAADPGSATFTGCLNPSSGGLSNVAAGSQPLKKCASGETTITLGGGDITAVTAGTGLTGGAASGAATLGLDSTYQLPQGCTSFQVPQWDGVSWYCDADDDTTYTGANFATSGQSCAAGDVVKGISATGAVICAADQDTTYSGANFAKSGASCAAGKYVSGINASGDLVCTDLPAAATPTLDVVSVTARAEVGALTTAEANAACPAGYSLVGGGWAAFNIPVDYAGYYQFSGANTYTVNGFSNIPGSVSSRAFCAKIS